MTKFDVFILYHAGQGDKNRSSYNKAVLLYDFFT